MVKIFALCYLLILSVIAYDPVRVDFFVMSKCPFAADFEIGFDKHVLQHTGLPSIIDLHVNFIASVNPDSPLGFNSLHGPTEVSGDLIEICAYNLTSSKNSSWWDFYLCLDNQYPSIPTNAQACAQKTGISWEEVNKCENSALGKQLLTKSIQFTDSLNVNESPTIYINNKFYCIWTGSPCKANTLDDFRTEICREYQGPKPAGCA
eukprot:TRINITY_DN6159_c0_g1_i1.p1 TRINITY_DN6159_c0_g1~~TRINITY_DN6159_c0_g1_i1.p1  ORF type:complete len:217 (-),score=32.87 TRINITY_DN6159_c0_g1_i1:72-689(-)